MLTIGDRRLDSLTSSASSDTKRASSEAHFMVPLFIALLSRALMPLTLTSASSSSVVFSAFDIKVKINIHSSKVIKKIVVTRAYGLKVCFWFNIFSSSNFVLICPNFVHLPFIFPLCLSLLLFVLAHPSSGFRVSFQLPARPAAVGPKSQ
uniref:Uncharacterized protein n=1 Tax=Rhipicephalus microplus TaxID=6941 RepID=A0A6G5AGV4_RHIMP